MKFSALLACTMAFGAYAAPALAPPREPSGRLALRVCPCPSRLLKRLSLPPMLTHAQVSCPGRRCRGARHPLFDPARPHHSPPRIPRAPRGLSPLVSSWPSCATEPPRAPDEAARLKSPSRRETNISTARPRPHRPAPGRGWERIGSWAGGRNGGLWVVPRQGCPMRNSLEGFNLPMTSGRRWGSYRHAHRCSRTVSPKGGG